MQKKTSRPATAIIIAVLTLLPLLSVLPASGATITGRPTLLWVKAHIENADGTLYVLPANFIYNATTRTHINSYDQRDLIAINITGMTITGAQIWLWLSETGGAVIETGDMFYAGPFSLSDVTASVVNYTKVKDPYSEQRFWVGDNLVIGPLPTGKVVPRGAEYYVKITDVAPTTPTIPSSDVAVSMNKWKPYESLTISPTWGPAGTTVTVKGMAWDNTKLVNISFSTSFTALTPVVNALIAPFANGTFTRTFEVSDSKIANGVDLTKYVNGYYNGTLTVVAYKTFTEKARVWLQIKAPAPANQGNGWVVPGKLYVKETIYVSGNFFNPKGPVDLYWDWGTTLAETLKASFAVNGTGFFNVSVVVPIAKIGVHTVSAKDLTFNLNATVSVWPTLILTPDKGPVETQVKAEGYGFPAKGTPAAANVYNVTLTWDLIDACTPKAVNMTWAWTDAKGSFVISFKVPHTVGGAHNVTAVANDTARTTAWDLFTVVPTIALSPSTLYNNGTVVTVNMTGLAYRQAYDLNLDNHKDFLVAGDCIGDFTMKFVAAAGFDAGVHVATMYKTNGTGFNPAYESHVLFTVNSVERDVLVDKLDEALDNLDEIKESLGDLTDLVTDESAQIDNVEAAILDAIETARGDVSALAQQLADIEILATTAAEQASSAAASSSTAASNASDAKTAAQGAQSTASGISIAVYGAVILSLIAALASIVAVITLQRKVAG